MKKRTNKNKLQQTDREVFKLQADLCKAFASPVRIELLDVLGKGECSVTELHRKLEVTRTNLSQHLSVLRAAGVVETRRDGKQTYCSLALPEVKQACTLIGDVLRAHIREQRKIFFPK
jgi:DNA-binding transcriptional ArsR family regulator